MHNTDMGKDRMSPYLMAANRLPSIATEHTYKS